MQTTPRTDIHASDIVEETQNRLHTAKHAFINKATRENNSTRYADGMQKAKETIIKDTQCYEPTKATIHKLQCDLIAIQRAIYMKPDSIQHIKIHVRHTKQT